ncbi:DEAD/DEAH box helicase family protein [Tritrichomonas foetus]|uniref:DEAD/DEAH box helicase family protein n=1 Tax=Tritrichomonas foetus TaxID=1144522 RepID=A0A1J4JH38_9EUKA|nr:DEAD/DEAH box helicase family protein [Tritrichomonas foetus]|eukprot:OHS98472.1 DEAD/DEAH box helicase family protein [Tritrichomonas foetus]
MIGNKTFQSLGLLPEICSASESYGWKYATQIQESTIPKAARGEDVAGMAQTGSGKTGAYLLPLLNRLMTEGKPTKFGVILAPTRELVLQIAEVCEALSKNLDISIVTAYGGVSDVEQMAQLAKQPNIIIATPGRLSQLLTEAKGFKINTVKVIVVDEADKMAGISFYDDIRVVVSAAAKPRQLLLFSATMPHDVERLAELSLSNTAVVKLTQRQEVPKTLKEFMVVVPPGYKQETVLSAILEENQQESILIFVETCRIAQILADTLIGLDYSIALAHGRMDQEEREKQIELFKLGEKRILISTNVVSRGIDLPRIDIVVNYDLPSQPKEYIHRAGRAGRANKEGVAISMVTKDSRKEFVKLENFLKRRLEKMDIDEDDLKHWEPLVIKAKDKAVEKYKIASREKPQRNK